MMRLLLSTKFKQHAFKRSVPSHLKLFCFALFFLASCKKEQELEADKSHLLNLLQVEDRIHEIDLANVTYERVSGVDSYKIALLDKTGDTFLVLEYLTLKASAPLTSGIYTFKRTRDLQNFEISRFYNAYLKFTEPGREVWLDGLSGHRIDGGELNIESINADSAAFDVRLEISEKKVTAHYNGPVKIEEFS